MENLQRWATSMCGTPLRVGDTVQVFDNTLPGYNVSAADFPSGGCISKVTFTGKERPLQCEMLVKPPIGGAGAKVLPSGVKLISSDASHSNSSGTPPSHSNLPGTPSVMAAASSFTEAEQLRMERDIMAQRLAASTAKLGATKKQKVAAEMKAASLEATTSSLETDLDLARSRHAHHLSRDNEEGERSGVVCVVVVMPFPGVCHSRVGPDPT